MRSTPYILLAFLSALLVGCQKAPTVDEQAVAITAAGAVALKNQKTGEIDGVILNGSSKADNVFLICRGIKTLKKIELMNVPMSDAAYADLFQLKTLTTLWINEGNFTDKQTASVAKMTNLQAFAANKTQITDQGLANLSTLSKLETLGLQSTAISGTGLKSLGPKNLTALFLDETQIDDDAMKHIATFDKLKDLQIGQTNATNDGLMELVNLPDLAQIQAIETKINRQGVDDFNKRRSASPNNLKPVKFSVL